MNLRGMFTRETYPLHQAVLANNPSLIKSHLENGADVNQADKGGITAIELAAKLNHWNCVSLFLDQPKHLLNPEALGNVLLYRLQHLSNSLIKAPDELINQLLSKNLRIDWTKEPGAEMVRWPELNPSLAAYVISEATMEIKRMTPSLFPAQPEKKNIIEVVNNKYLVKQVGLVLLRAGIDSAMHLLARPHNDNFEQPYYPSYRIDYIESVIEILVKHGEWENLLIFLNEIQTMEPAKLTRIEYLDKALKKAIEQTEADRYSDDISLSPPYNVIQAFIRAKRASTKANLKALTIPGLTLLESEIVNMLQDPCWQALFQQNHRILALLLCYTSNYFSNRNIKARLNLTEIAEVAVSRKDLLALSNRSPFWATLLAGNSNYFTLEDFFKLTDMGQKLRPYTPFVILQAWETVASSRALTQAAQLAAEFLKVRQVIMALHHHAQNKKGIQPDNAYLILLPTDMRLLIDRFAFEELLEKFSLSTPNEFFTNHRAITKEAESLVEEVNEEATLIEIFKIIYTTIIAYRSTRKIDFLADKKDKTSKQLEEDIKIEIAIHPHDSVSTAWQLAKKYKNNYLQDGEINVDLFLDILLYSFEHHGMLKACSFLGPTFYRPATLRDYISKLTKEDKEIIGKKIAEMKLDVDKAGEDRHTMIIAAFRAVTRKATANPNPHLRLRQTLFQPTQATPQLEKPAAHRQDAGAEALPTSPPPQPSQQPAMNTNRFFKLMAQAPTVRGLPAPQPNETQPLSSENSTSESERQHAF